MDCNEISYQYDNCPLFIRQTLNIKSLDLEFLETYMDHVIKYQPDTQFSLLSGISLAQYFLKNGVQAATELLWTWCTFDAPDSSETNILRIYF